MLIHFLISIVSQDGLIEESVCGRPLGMAFDTISDSLIVADAYYGIWSVDLKTGKKQQLVSPKEELDGEVSVFIKQFELNNMNMKLYKRQII